MSNAPDNLQQTKYPTDYNLIAINLIANQQSVSLKPFMVELSYFEDLYGCSISGEILISDTLGLIANHMVNGTEFIELEFKKDYTDSKPIKRTFRVYKVSKRKIDLNNMYENFVMKFCSEELLLSEQYRISKSYKNKKISEMISDILKNYLKVGSNDKKIDIEETKGTYDFILPNKKIFETVNWLSSYALPASNKPGADMVFFENAEGYSFKSLQTLFSQPSYTKYYFNPKNISPDMNQMYYNIMEFEAMDSFDMIDGISEGTFVNKVISIDPLTRQFKTTTFNYDQYFNKAKSLNGAKITNNYKNRLGFSTYETPRNDLQTGSFRLVASNSSQRSAPYISKKADAVGADIFIENFLPNRAAQLSLANYVRVKASVPGNPRLTVGMAIDLEIFSVKPVAYTDSQGKTLDPFYSGKYIISAVRHIIQNMTYITVLELTKDSFSKTLPSVNNTSTAVKALSGGLL